MKLPLYHNTIELDMLQKSHKLLSETNLITLVISEVRSSLLSACRCELQK
jgi:hypothetical protein